MLIFHTADWHLGNIFHRHDRLAEHRHFFNWLIAQLKERQPDVMIVSGDIFDNANPSASAEQMFYEVLKEATMTIEGLQIVIIAGNHDSAHRLEAPSPFLKANNIYVRGYVKRTEAGTPDFADLLLPLSSRTESEAKVVCLALPFLRSADYPSGLSVGEGIKYYVEGMLKALHHTEFKKLPLIAAAHFYAAGAEISEEHSERLVIGGQDVVLTKSVDKAVRYTALGHIHRGQCVDHDRQMWYSGSALPLSFSEKHYNHGINCVHLSEEGKCSVEQLHYTPLRKLRSIPEKGAATTAEVMEALESLPSAKEMPNREAWDYLEIRVREQQPEPTFLAEVTEALREKAVYFCRIVRETTVHLTSDQEAVVSNAALHITPEEMAQRFYQQRYGEEMPQEMMERFTQAMN
jgi:exonuclease SbcD